MRKRGCQHGSVEGFDHYSYLNASAGNTLAADDDGYTVASSEIPIDTIDTITPSRKRGAKGSVSME